MVSGARRLVEHAYMGEGLECLSIDEKSRDEVTTLGVKVGVKESFVAR